LSPYASRVRVSIYAKKLPIEIVAPPAAGIKSAEYLALNPMGKIPVLLLDDGVSIPESETIVEYLEDAFPDPSLRPHGPEAAARVRLIARIAELYVMSPLSALYPHLDPARRDEAAVDAAMSRLESGISYLETFMAHGPYAAGEKFTTADGQVTPTVFYLNAILSRLDRLEAMSRHERLSSYIRTAKADPVLAKVMGEMAEALKISAR
jgi:glutathione S-transferase